MINQYKKTIKLYFLKNKKHAHWNLLASWEMRFCFGVTFSKSSFLINVYIKPIILLLLPDKRNSAAVTLKVN